MVLNSKQIRDFSLERIKGEGDDFFRREYEF